jgi:glycosyltransferase involved in cell wall biosynthesis
MSQLKISAVIITLNEEHNIARCLDSLQNIVDEIVVLDSFSSDNTAAICRQKNVHFIQKEWQGYASSKNYANSQAKYDYIFSIDADEVVSPQLKESIQALKNREIVTGYYVNRRTNYCGKWILHCGWYPDCKLRLWDRRQGEWQGVIHEQVILDPAAPTEVLTGDLLHYSFKSIDQHIDTANRFSHIAARQAVSEGRRVHFLTDVLLNPPFTFLRKYIFQLGFLDGYYGFIICKISAFANFLKYIKIWDYNRRASQTDSDQPHR